MKYKAILFDLDGTLTKSEEGIINSVRYSAAKVGCTLNESDLRKFIGPPLIISFKSFCHLSDEAAQEAVKCYREYYSEKGIFENSLYEGVLDLLDKIKSSGSKIALVTSKPDVYAIKILKFFSIDGYFSSVSACSLQNSTISKKDLIERALSELGVEAKDAVMIGDTRFDIEGAKAAGTQSVFVTYGYGTLEEMEASFPDYIASDSDNLLTILKK